MHVMPASEIELTLAYFPEDDDERITNEDVDAKKTRQHTRTFQGSDAGQHLDFRHAARWGRGRVALMLLLMLAKRMCECAAADKGRSHSVQSMWECRKKERKGLGNG
jgi:hypothetical protein